MFHAHHPYLTQTYCVFGYAQGVYPTIVIIIVSVQGTATNSTFHAPTDTDGNISGGGHTLTTVDVINTPLSTVQLGGNRTLSVVMDYRQVDAEFRSSGFAHPVEGLA